MPTEFEERDPTDRPLAALGRRWKTRRDVAVGILAKSATKKRTVATAGPLNAALIKGPWVVNGGVLRAALIRSAVLAVDLVGARSSSNRGRTSVFAPSYTSQFWVPMVALRHWRTSASTTARVGSPRTGQSTSRSADDDVAVTTPTYLTKDGALMHGEQRRVKIALLHALALGEQSPAKDEIELSAQSLTRVLTFDEAAPPAERLDFTLFTDADAAVCEEQLKILGLRKTAAGEGEIRLAIGLPTNDALDYVTLRIEPGRVAGHGEIGSDSEMSRRIAARGMGTCVAAVSHSCDKRTRPLATMAQVAGRPSMNRSVSNPTPSSPRCSPAVPPATHWSGFSHSLVVAAQMLPRAALNYTVKRPTPSRSDERCARNRTVLRRRCCQASPTRCAWSIVNSAPPVPRSTRTPSGKWR